MNTIIVLYKWVLQSTSHAPYTNSGGIKPYSCEADQFRLVHGLAYSFSMVGLVERPCRQ